MPGNDQLIVEENRDRGANRPTGGRGFTLKEHRENEAGRAPQAPPRVPELKPMPCGHHKQGGRNLILCIDGTANQFGKKNTNVIEIYNLIMKETGDNQRTWYNSGIGTYARPHWRSLKYYKQVVFHKIDLAIAWNFEKTVQAAYQWLSDNYEDGDCIFLFGFSRGAFQVRALSAMIHKVGLIHKGNEMQIPFAYELYADSETDRELIAPVGSAKPEASPEQVAAERTSMIDRLKEALRFTKKEAPVEQPGAQAISMAERFKRAFSRKNVKVHFVGAWDTVSSIGIARGKRVLPGTTDGMGHVCYFRHALALDERRVKFLPEYAWGGKTLIPLSNADVDRKGDPPQVMEVWFAGTHSDIGGGNVQNIGMDRSRPPLRWMASEAEALGLRLESFQRELSSSEQIEFQESLIGLWHLFEVLPFRRLTFARSPDCKETTRMPHFWSERKIHEGQKIHSSLILAETPRPYIPKARPPPLEANHRTNEDVGPRLPRSDDGSKIQPEPESGSTEDRGTLHRLLRPFRRTRTVPLSESREQTFWDDLRKDGLSNSNGWLEIDVFEYAKMVLKRFMEGKEVEDTLKQIVRDHSGEGAQAVYDEVIEIMSLWDRSTPPAEAKCRLLRITIGILGDDLGHLKLQKWRRIWAGLAHLSTNGSNEERKMAEDFLRRYTQDINCLFELQGHTRLVQSVVQSVAISADGKRIVCGSSDHTIRIWDMDKGAQIGELLLGHGNTINSVAISPNGKLIASGSDDKTIRIWDAETGTQVGEPLLGHTDSVWSVAISHDGQHIISGSSDKTVRIWDAAAGTQIGVPLQEHIEVVWSVAISHKGKRIVSGSSDGTVRIWDAETGRQVGEPLQGHTDWVWFVTISPDGNHIFSGSRDKTIRIWDAETGTQVGEPLREHSSGVFSIAISPEGKHIVSGSEDKTIRIWDLETGKQVGEPLRGHTDYVTSVAISPDGKRIVSGSWDGTVRIWDAERVLV
ncbi:hypothetical protein H1R20_g1846, partial [Candolleomyces eurysporus]